MRRLFALISSLILFAACDTVSSVIHNDEVVASLGKEKLYLSEVRGCVPAFATPEDSAMLVQQYIDKWALSVLYMQQADAALSKEELDVERELEEYRRSLIRYRFEQAYVREHLDTAVSSEQVQAEVLNNHIVEHALTIPVRVQYNIPLWKQLSMHLYGGPQLMVGLAQTDYVDAQVSPDTREWLLAQGKHLDTYDKYIAKELFRTNFMLGVGGGFTWDRYRLEAGYDFGLNNLIRTPVYSKDRMAEWQWHVSFVYTL